MSVKVTKESKKRMDYSQYKTALSQVMDSAISTGVLQEAFVKEQNANTEESLNSIAPSQKKALLESMGLENKWCLDNTKYRSEFNDQVTSYLTASQYLSNAREKVWQDALKRIIELEERLKNKYHITSPQVFDTNISAMRASLIQLEELIQSKSKVEKFIGGSSDTYIKPEELESTVEIITTLSDLATNSDYYVKQMWTIVKFNFTADVLEMTTWRQIMSDTSTLKQLNVSIFNFLQFICQVQLSDETVSIQDRMKFIEILRSMDSFLRKQSEESLKNRMKEIKSEEIEQIAKDFNNDDV